jgi:hypothetical protein
MESKINKKILNIYSKEGKKIKGEEDKVKRKPTQKKKQEKTNNTEGRKEGRKEKGDWRKRQKEN